jgi:putative transposase
MRYPRQKIKDKGCYYHIVNHVSGPRNDLPFSEEDKTMGFQIVTKLQKLYILEVISLCWMNNHFHIILYSSGKKMPVNEVVDRYNSFYKKDIYNHPPLNINDNLERCYKIAEKLNDISEFMRSFQQRFTYWFNKKENRQGPLWKSRFWSCILEGSVALWECVKYVELNPVRAGLVDDPGKYNYSSWGRFGKNKRHPFYANFVKHMGRNSIHRTANCKRETSHLSVTEIFDLELKAIVFFEGRMSETDQKRMFEDAKAREELIFSRFLIKVKNWTSGMIIGSAKFVEKTAERFFQSEFIAGKRKGYGRSCSGDTLVCFHRGRKNVPI